MPAGKSSETDRRAAETGTLLARNVCAGVLTVRALVAVASATLSNLEGQTPWSCSLHTTAWCKIWTKTWFGYTETEGDLTWRGSGGPCPRAQVCSVVCFPVRAPSSAHSTWQLSTGSGADRSWEKSATRQPRSQVAAQPLQFLQQ